MQRIAVTGGAGFIGSALVRYLAQTGNIQVLNIDKLTYAGNLDNLPALEGMDCYQLQKIDICDRAAIADAINNFRPHAIFHLAAESHVDRSIDTPDDFVQTNVVGTTTLLDAALAYWKKLDDAEQQAFRFVHVSTDEVYGSLGETGLFSEESPIQPNSPYATSKAASDLFARTWYKTYGLPVIVGNCSNNYGPYQFPEKLIPVVILAAIEGRDIPVYGAGENVRDWLFVEDHVDALVHALEKGAPGETYNFGGDTEIKNIDLVRMICTLLDEMASPADGRSYLDQIIMVTDRPGHDFRYAIDYRKAKRDLGWAPRTPFDQGLRRTISWYLDNAAWWRPIRENKRLGLQRVNEDG